MVSRAGYTPITTCSPTNFEFVKSLGAAAAFDYHDPDCVEKIQQFAKEIRYVWDTISLAGSVQICSQVISSGGNYGSIIKVQFPRDDVKCTFSLGYTAVGEPVTKGANHFPDCSKDFEFCKAWMEFVEAAVHDGRVKVHPIQVERGLENALDGIDLLRHNQVTGKKLVYLI